MGTEAGPAEPERLSTGFEVHVHGRQVGRLLERGDLYTAALAFLDGRVEIEGDLIAALRDLMSVPRRGPRQWLYTVLARLWSLRLETWYQTRTRARRNVRFHYDHPAAFYRQFLDQRLVYSCAYFERSGMTLDQAQTAKLDHICRKLDLRPGERFLDVGCGFGALVAHAAEVYGAESTGCTLSRGQFETAGALLRERGLEGRASVEFLDYRDLRGRFAKIASVGMFEHVGVRRLSGYFAKVGSLLAPGGLFLNHGIARPQVVRAGPEWVFVQRRVFPGGELPHLSEVVREAEKAGFEILDVENLRPHYARTCRTWVERLSANREECLRLVPPAVYRTWLLYLAVSALNFETGMTEVHQVLMARRSQPRAGRWTRRYMYP